MMTFIIILTIIGIIVLIVPVYNIVDPVIKATYKDEMLTLHRKSGDEEKYLGDCTCWQTYPDMYDVNTLGERRLYRYWSLCRRSENGIWELN